MNALKKFDGWCINSRTFYLVLLGLNLPNSYNVFNACPLQGFGFFNVFFFMLNIIWYKNLSFNSCCFVASTCLVHLFYIYSCFASGFIISSSWRTDLHICFNFFFYFIVVWQGNIADLLIQSKIGTIFQFIRSKITFDL